MDTTSYLDNTPDVDPCCLPFALHRLGIYEDHSAYSQEAEHVPHRYRCTGTLKQQTAMRRKVHRKSLLRQAGGR